MGAVRDIPLALPQLTGVHTGEKIAETVTKIFQKSGVLSHRLGCFVLDNAYANDTAVGLSADMYSFNAHDCCLRCGPHILNLVGQQVIFGRDKDAYQNNVTELAYEDTFM